MTAARSHTPAGARSGSHIRPRGVTTPNILLRAEDWALGTRVRLVLAQGDQAALSLAKAAMDAVLRDIDDTCSRFREDSELTRLNAGAGREHAVSPLLGRAIAEALRAAALTDGDVDLTVGGAVRRAGYDVDFAAIPADGGPITVTARPIPGWRLVRYAAAGHRFYAPAGIEIDLGATAKALAADLAAVAALEALHGTGGVLVSLGGDIALAGTPPPGGWTVQVSEDSGAPLDDASERITLQSGAIATSSSITAAPIEEVFGTKAQSSNGMVKVTIGRNAWMHGVEVGNEMGVNTWAAFAGSDRQAVVDGDFAMVEGDLQVVLKTLRSEGINIVAIHQHMTTEVPRYVFLHYWGKGSAVDLAKAIKKALNTQQPTKYD